MRYADFSELVGQTLTAVENRAGEELVFTTDEGRIYTLFHEQDCCESVTIDDITGELSDLIGAPILMAEEATNSDDPPAGDWVPDSFTWTFYKLATIKGYVTIRWYGESNGYYSESVSFKRTDQAA